MKGGGLPLKFSYKCMLHFPQDHFGDKVKMYEETGGTPPPQTYIFKGGGLGVRVAAYLHVKCLVRTKSLISADFDPTSLFGDYFPGGGCSGCCIFTRKMPCTDKIFDFSRFRSKIFIW